jgi:GT2 family glycosyltransferase
MTSATRPLAVLIVAYRAADMLEKCIESIGRHLPDVEVHIWDNSGPTSADVRHLAGRMPHAHWYLGGDNIGFAAAVNRLAAKVPQCDVLLLNPDAELVGSLSSTRAAITDPRTAAVAPLIWEPGVEDGLASGSSRSRRPWDVAHRRRTLLNALCEVAIAAERVRGTAMSNLYRERPTDVDGYLTGACLAVSRDAWDSLGSFNEEFFLYGEEADWQRRAIAAGWRVRLVDEPGVRHSALGTVAGDAAASGRSWDLVRASLALQLEYTYGSHIAEFYIAGAFLIEALKRRAGRRDDDDVAHSDVVVTVDGSRSASSSERVSLASALARNGSAVTVVSLQPLGTLPRELPACIRLLRRPWWWPWTWPGDAPTLLITGKTKRERAFARLFRLRGRSACGADAAGAGMSDDHLNPNYDLESI